MPRQISVVCPRCNSPMTEPAGNAALWICNDCGFSITKQAMADPQIVADLARRQPVGARSVDLVDLTQLQDSVRSFGTRLSQVINQNMPTPVRAVASGPEGTVVYGPDGSMRLGLAQESVKAGETLSVNLDPGPSLNVPGVDLGAPWFRNNLIDVPFYGMPRVRDSILLPFREMLSALTSMRTRAAQRGEPPYPPSIAAESRRALFAVCLAALRERRVSLSELTLVLATDALDELGVTLTNLPPPLGRPAVTALTDQGDELDVRALTMPAGMTTLMEQFITQRALVLRLMGTFGEGEFENEFGRRVIRRELNVLVTLIAMDSSGNGGSFEAWLEGTAVGPAQDSLRGYRASGEGITSREGIRTLLTRYDPATMGAYLRRRPGYVPNELGGPGGIGRDTGSEPGAATVVTRRIRVRG